jgi:hypothetical protein
MPDTLLVTRSRILGLILLPIEQKRVVFSICFEHPAKNQLSQDSVSGHRQDETPGRI